MRLISTLSLGAAALALLPLAAAGQQRLAASQPAVPAALAPASSTSDEAPTSAPAAAAPAASAPAAEPAQTASITPVITPNPLADGIAATVNDASISDYELEQRIAMHIAVSGYKPNADDLKRVRKEMLDRLEEEKIQLADARKHKITVSPVEVNKEIERFAKGHNVSVQQLTDVLSKAGTSIEVLRTELTAAAAWQKTLEAEFGGQDLVSPAMITEGRQRAAEGANKVHYHPFEIFLQVDSPEKDAEVKKQIDDIEAKIRADPAAFPVLAQQFSRNPSAALGGDIGWVYDGQLDPEINNVLAKLHVGELAKPVRGKGGWYLIGLKERQEAAGTDVSAPVTVAPAYPPGTLPLARLLLPLNPGTPQDVIENNLKVAATQIRPAITSCEVMEKISQDPALKNSVFMNPLQFAKLLDPGTNAGVIKLSELSEDMQKALAQTKPGDVAEPFVSPAGVEIIARCDPRPPPPRVAFKIPSEDEIHEQLFQDQIAALAKRYMRDLKRDANIQERDQANSAIMDAALIP
jgi:peptidyl-prolyl cis-trans isomerase SurA